MTRATSARRAGPLVSASLCAVALAACGSAQQPSGTAPRPAASTSLPPHVMAVVQTDHGPASFPLDATSVYVANHRGGTIQRVDPETNRIMATSLVGGELNMPNGGDPRWACTNVNSVVYHLDAATLAKLSDEQTSCDGGDIAVIDGVVWAVPGPDGPREAVLFDADSGALLRRVPVPSNVVGGTAIRLADGHVALTGGRPLPLFTVQGEPAGSVDADVSWLFQPIGGTLYRVPEDGRVMRVDPATLRSTVVATVPPHDENWNGAFTGDGKDRLWYRPDPTSLYEVDLSTGAVRLLMTLPDAEVATGIQYAFGSLWVTNFNADTVWRIDPDQ